VRIWHCTHWVGATKTRKNQTTDEVSAAIFPTVLKSATHQRDFPTWWPPWWGRTSAKGLLNYIWFTCYIYLLFHLAVLGPPPLDKLNYFICRDLLLALLGLFRDHLVWHQRHPFVLPSHPVACFVGRDLMDRPLKIKPTHTRSRIFRDVGFNEQIIRNRRRSHTFMNF
jgi:hypothetical protein